MKYPVRSQPSSPVTGANSVIRVPELLALLRDRRRHRSATAAPRTDCSTSTSSPRHLAGGLALSPQA
ncbi:MAG: hypothetical protein U1F77_01285 [Kiritimatiellia bacterium]